MRREQRPQRNLPGVATLAFALATLTSILLLCASQSAFALITPKADYQFQVTRSSAVGTAPALTDIGPGTNAFTTAAVDGTSHKMLSFPKDNGVQLSPTTGVISNGTYTIVALFEFDDVSSWRRIVDFKNGTHENGLYVKNGDLEFYPHEIGSGAPIAANTYVQVALTRDSSGTVVGYVNGVQQFSFADTGNDAVIDSNNTLRFFRDNESGTGCCPDEESGGSVARIRLYDSALKASQVAALDRLPSLRIGDARVKEGNTNALFVVRLSSSSQQAVTVNYATANGSAKAPADYTAKSGTLTFAPGETSKTVAVAIRGDRRDERNETFFVNLSGANTTVADARGRATIVDND